MRRYIEVSDDFILIPGRVAIAFARIDAECYMIDAGLDRDQARRAVNIAKELSLNIKVLLNTHSHADHIGGNKFVVNRLGIPVYADKRELPYIQNPTLEATMLYGGHPPKGLRNKFFMAKPVIAMDIATVPLPLEVVDLGGHSPGMIGLRIGEILFTADAYFPRDILNRHVIPYTYDPERALETLGKLLNMSSLKLIPSHGEPADEPEEDIEANIMAINRVKESLIDTISGEKTIEEIAAEVFSDLGVNISSIGLYHLYVSIIRSYMTWLEGEGYITPEIRGKRLVWHRIKK